METTSMHEAGLMAAWRATGGARDAAAGEDSGRDGGQAASATTVGGFCLFGEPRLAACEPSFSRMCFVDDGLTASENTFNNMCFPDDTLEATSITSPASFNCRIDDGLQVTGPTQSRSRCF